MSRIYRVGISGLIITLLLTLGFMGMLFESILALPGFAWDKIKATVGPRAVGVDVKLSLSLASTDQLCEELLARYDHISIVGLRSSERVGHDELIELRYQKGNSRTVQGLLMGMLIRIEHDVDARKHPIKGDE